MSIRESFYKTIYITLVTGLILVLIAALISAFIQWYLIPQLPSPETLKDIRLQVPLRIYTKDEVFITEYGEQRRIPMNANKIPKSMIQAVLAAEDDRFYEHPGVDLKGILRATVMLLKTGEKTQGGSTITMQVARNFFLSPKQTYTRKLKEILLALQIEEKLTKEEIIELYLNKIFFGHRAYGVGAAAQIYYGKEVSELTLAEQALLAGLPKAPSSNNPLTNPKTALARRNYVLERMLKLGYIEPSQYEEALRTPNTAHLHELTTEIEAAHIAEMVRSDLLARFGEEATYSNGYRVYTTIDSHLQAAAQAAVRDALFLYDERHGYRGVTDHVSIPHDITPVEEFAHPVLGNYPKQGNLIPSLVLQAKGKSIVAYNRVVGQFEIDWSDMSWARRYISENRRGRYPNNARDIVKPGDIIMVRPLQVDAEKKPEIPPNSAKKTQSNSTSLNKNQQSGSAKQTEPASLPQRWRLAQKPSVEGALVALEPNSGAIVALVGGFDYKQSKFNRVTQAARQPGSTFKPFIYSAAIAKGYSDSSIVNDSPISFRVGRKQWRPLNYGRRYYGPTTFRKALASSYNVSAVKVLQKIGVSTAIDHIIRFGFQRENIPKNLTIALGTSNVTPLELARGFTTFANGGYRIQPYFIERIEDATGKIIFSANPLRVCHQCPAEILASHEETISGLVISQSDCAPAPRYAPQVISYRNAQIMTSMLKDVIRMGTARRAYQVFKRNDIAGKTGTTNDLRDAWFSGYSPDLVTTVWVGFDQPRSLGAAETGGRTALPMWISFMQDYLRGQNEQAFPLDRDRGNLVRETPIEEPDSTTGEVEETQVKKKKSTRSSTTISSSKSRASKRKIIRRSTATSSSDSTNSSSTRVTPPRRSNSVVPEQLF
ncbi:penicillin-binding protein, 1A family [Thioploca ingrica]|uniref:Penicillin-binding protein 1A n=1 Tax=Thioploca ingrica TaxID=40754 RepID=A0A090AKU8_9GAMM|nr:penicillin-binding protein, 1A family [Thioploca ingrica]